MKNEAQEIAKKSKSSFYYAFNLLPEAKRDAMNTVYAFCRETDDIVDENSFSDDQKWDKLTKWRIELEKAIYGNSEYSLLNKLSKIIQQFNIPLEPFFELIKGMEMDIQKKTYLTTEDLVQYCYRVASTVGLMCIEIFGYKNNSTRDYAINLGVALQLTNIMRDVKKDADYGRIYLPKNNMDKFNYSESDLMQGVYNSNFIEMMSAEGEKAEYYFEKANNNLNLDDKPALFAARAMQHIYYKLLQKLHAEKYNVFHNKINVSKFDKTAIAVGVWAKYSLVY